MAAFVTLRWTAKTERNIVLHKKNKEAMGILTYTKVLFYFRKHVYPI